MRRSVSHVIVIATFLLAASLAGCADEAPDETQSGDPSGRQDARSGNVAPPDPWGGGKRLLIVDARSQANVEADVLCTFGGGPELPRTEHRIVNGTGTLEVTVGVDASSTGIQVGYAVDASGAGFGGSAEGVTWLPSVPPGAEQTFEVDVEPSQVEIGAKRWAFYYQMNPGVEDLCYTGALVAGERWAVVEAVRL